MSHVTSYTTKSWAIVAYIYQADIHCPKCVGKMFGPTFGRPTEHVLTTRARKRGIDRWDEGAFDSGDFPKIIFSSDANDGGYEHCGTCKDCIAHDLRDCGNIPGDTPCFICGQEKQHGHDDTAHEPNYIIA